MNEKMKNSTLGAVLFTRTFWVALIIQMLYSIASSSVKQPLNLYAKELGASATILGFVTSLYSFCKIFIRAPFGTAVDKFDKRKVLCGVYIYAAIVYMLYAWTNSLGAYIFIRILHGFLFGMTNIAMATLIGKNIKSSAMGTAFGMLTLIPKLLAGISSYVSIQITTAFGVEYSLYAGAVLSVVCGVLVWLIKDDKNAAKQPPAKKRTKGPLVIEAIPFAIVQLLIIMPAFAQETFLLIYCQENGIAYGAAYLAIYTSSMGIGSAVCGFFNDKLGAKFTMYPVIIMSILSALIPAVSNNYLLWMLSAVMLGVCNGGIGPITRSTTIRSIDPARTSLAIATLAIFQDIANLLANSTAGVIADAIGYVNMFLMFTALPVLALVIAVLILPKLLKQAEIRAQEQQAGAETT